MTSYEAQQEALAAAKAFVPIAKEHFPYSAVYLFGSYAKGYTTEHSDIDVAVIIPDYGDMTPEEIRLAMRDLWMRGGDIDLRIEPVVRTMHDGSGFVRAILETGISVD